MNAMKGSRLIRFSVAVAFVCALAGLSAFAQHRGRKYKAAPPTSRFDVTILRNDDGHPIENAAVVFHLVGDKGNMELRTNEDGKTMIDVLPTGSRVLVQVIAKGYQTYGGDYNLDKAEKAIEIKLKRPGQQYSIYEQHPDDASAKPPAKDGDKSSPDKSSPDESAKQNEAKPDSSQPQPQ